MVYARKKRQSSNLDEDKDECGCTVSNVGNLAEGGYHKCISERLSWDLAQNGTVYDEFLRAICARPCIH